MQYIIPFAVSFITVMVLIPVIHYYALAVGFVDRPTNRKIHVTPIPLMGGAAIYLAVLLALWWFLGTTPLTQAITLGGALLVGIGLIDDWYKSMRIEFPIWPRVIIYIIASSVPIWFGIKIIGISDGSPFGMYYFTAWFSWLSTMLWVFALMNMVNFIDGVDGLAAGIVAISSGALFFVAALKGNENSAILALVIAGACLAFLIFNFHPAKIFMGDAGAVFLGYTLAVLSVEGTMKSTTIVTVGISVLALAVPIMDTVIVFTRRLAEHRGLHRADKLHTHHSLMKWGLSQTQTVSFLYLIGGVFSLLAIIVYLLFR